MTGATMKARVTTRGLDGLGARLAARALPAATEAAAARAARRLAGLVAAETGQAPEIAGDATRPLVRVRDAAVLSRVRGSAQQEGEPLLDRARLAFARKETADAVPEGEDLP